MLTIESKLRRDPGVVATELPGGETVLLHLTTKTYYSLNQTASRIWSLLDVGRSLADVSRELACEFELPSSRADASVLRLASSLEDENLVQPIEESGG